MKQIAKLVEVVSTSVYNKKYSLREIFINPDFVVSLAPDTSMKDLLTEGHLPDGIDDRQQFTRVVVHKGNSGQEMTVVGEVAHIREKLFSNGFSNRTILKG
tara:strand:+ start:276 stop:578 length:303 start_codon:yes stop_codon:yes gene_type:complete